MELTSSQARIPLYLPEGFAGIGNASAGISSFTLVVLEKNLSKLYKENDMIMRPTKFPVELSHSRNGTSDLISCVELLMHFTSLKGA